MLLVALALVWTSSSCGKLPLDTDPLESMAEVVSEDKRFPAPLSESWRRVPNHPIPFRPAVGTKSVYLVANEQLVAWSVGTGETLWDPVDLESEVVAIEVSCRDLVIHPQDRNSRQRTGSEKSGAAAVPVSKSGSVSDGLE